MTKVALITIHSLPNYGSVLQAYASQTILEKMGLECKIINYLFPNKWHFSNGISKTSKLKQFVLTLAVPVMKLVSYHSQHVLQDKLNRFKRRYFKFTKLYNSLEELEREDWSSFDIVIAGSDQIWSPRFVKGDKAFMLSFIPAQVKKISLSSSFGVTEIPDVMIEHYKKYLSEFDAIGVREESAVRLLRDTLALSNKISQILDPTLLLSASEWNRIAEKKDFSTPPYILFYGLYYSFEPRPFIFEVLKYLQKKTGLRIISLAGSQGQEGEETPTMENMENSSPEQFLALFRDAAMVVTTSFHGSAFALNYGKPLLSVVPDRGDDRQITLLTTLGVGTSIVKVGTPLEKLNPYYDKAELSSRLERIRKTDLSTFSQYIFNK